jgi:hypothetical protein
LAVIMTNLLYFTISLALVGMVGRALSRSGRAFLGAMPGGQDSAAEAVSRLLVVAFYLLSLGFIALTMQVWSHVGSPAQALRLVSVKLGELLLVLGALHVLSTVVYGRLRRARSWPAQADPGGSRPGAAGPADPGPADPGPADPGPADAGTGRPSTGRPVARGPAGPADWPAGAGARAASPVLWQPRPGRAVH